MHDQLVPPLALSFRFALDERVRILEKGLVRLGQEKVFASSMVDGRVILDDGGRDVVHVQRAGSYADPESADRAKNQKEGGR